MPPRLRKRELLKKPNLKRPGSDIDKKKFAKRPRPHFMPSKKLDLPNYDDSDDDFVKSDADSASSVQLSSESEDEEEKKEAKKHSKITAEVDRTNSFLLRADSIITNQFKLVDALNQMLGHKDQLLKTKDDIIAAKTAENERLQRMVRSLEIQ